MTITKSLTYSKIIFENRYSVLVMKGNEILIPYVNSSLIKIGICSFSSLEICSGFSFN